MSLITIDTTRPDIAVVTLNRPEKRNALSLQMMRELTEAVKSLSTKDRALVIAANGPVFCAGLDLHEAKDPALAEESFAAVATLFTTLYTAPCVILCAVHGDVVAGGMGLVLASDFAVMSEGAYVSFPEVKIGIVPAIVAVALRRQIAMRYVRELLLFGQKVDASRALCMGVVNKVVAAPDVFEETMACALDVVKNDRGATVSLKRALIELDPVPLATEVEQALTTHRLQRASARNAGQGTL